MSNLFPADRIQPTATATKQMTAMFRLERLYSLDAWRESHYEPGILEAVA